MGEIYRPRSQRCDKRESSPQLLLALYELSNIAPLYDLPEIIAEGGSQGVLTLACLQDLSQARRRWPTIADGFFTLFYTKFILPGLGDRQTLENISLLCGDRDEIVYSKTTHRKGSREKQDSRTASLRRVRRLPVDEVSRGKDGKALVLMGNSVGEVNLTPSYELQTSPPSRGSFTKVCSHQTIDSDNHIYDHQDLETKRPMENLSSKSHSWPDKLFIRTGKKITFPSSKEKQSKRTADNLSHRYQDNTVYRERSGEIRSL
jgi:hypothetical protein